MLSAVRKKKRARSIHALIHVQFSLTEHYFIMHGDGRLDFNSAQRKYYNDHLIKIKTEIL